MSENPWSNDKSIDKGRGILSEKAKEQAARKLLLCETHKLPESISDDETSLPGYILVNCAASGSKILKRQIGTDKLTEVL